MGLLSFLFGIPVLDKVEARLWDKAYQRYLEEGGSPVKDLKDLHSDVRGRLNGWVAEWLAEEDKKLRPIWREFKNRLQATTEEALSIVFAHSEQSWYSVEAGSLPSFPEAISAPVGVIRSKTQ